MEILKHYNLVVKEGLWKKFKRTMSKDDKINNVIIDLIEKRIKEFETLEKCEVTKS